MSAEVRIAHAVTVGFHVLEALGGFLAVVCKGAQRGQQPVQIPGLEFRAAGLGPGFAAVPVAGEQGPRDVPHLLGGVEEVDDLNGSGEHFRCRPPDPFRTVAEDDTSERVGEAAPLGLAPHAACEGGRFGIGVARGGAVDGGRVGGRTVIAGGKTVLVPAFRSPDHDQLDLAGAGLAVALLARPALDLRLAHRHAGAVNAKVHGGRRGGLGGEHGLALGGGDLLPQRLGDALDALGMHTHGGQFVEQVAGRGKARDRRGRARHARHGRRQAGAGHAERRVAGKPAPTARLAVVVGALQSQRAEGGLEGLRMPSRVARRPPATAGPDAGFAVGVVGVETPLDCPRRELQGLTPHMRLDRLEVELVGRAGRYEAGDLGFERRGELLLAGFFFTVLVPTLSRDWHRSSLTAIRSATRRRRRWHSAIWAFVASTCEAGIERLRVLPRTDQVSSQYGPWPRCCLSAQKQLGLPQRR